MSINRHTLASLPSWLPPLLFALLLAAFGAYAGYEVRGYRQADVEQRMKELNAAVGELGRAADELRRHVDRLPGVEAALAAVTAVSSSYPLLQQRVLELEATTARLGGAIEQGRAFESQVLQRLTRIETLLDGGTRLRREGMARPSQPRAPG